MSQTAAAADHAPKMPPGTREFTVR